MARAWVRFCLLPFWWEQRVRAERGTKGGAARRAAAPCNGRIAAAGPARCSVTLYAT